jgi:hypothetical protein
VPSTAGWPVDSGLVDRGFDRGPLIDTPKQVAESGAHVNRTESFETFSARRLAQADGVTAILDVHFTEGG